MYDEHFFECAGRRLVWKPTMPANSMIVQFKRKFFSFVEQRGKLLSGFTMGGTEKGKGLFGRLFWGYERENMKACAEVLDRQFLLKLHHKQR